MKRDQQDIREEQRIKQEIESLNKAHAEARAIEGRKV